VFILDISLHENKILYNKNIIQQNHIGFFIASYLQNIYVIFVTFVYIGSLGKVFNVNY